METLRTEKVQISKQRDVFITRTAIKTLKSEGLVKDIINFQFRDMIRALSTYSSIELTGFGKFYISQAKLKRKYAKHKRIITKLKADLVVAIENYKIQELERKILGMSEDLVYMYERFKEKPNDEDQCIQHSGGMEESSVPTTKTEGVDRGDLEE